MDNPVIAVTAKTDDHSGYSAISVAPKADDHSGYSAISVAPKVDDHSGYSAISVSPKADDHSGYPTISVSPKADDHSGYPAISVAPKADDHSGYSAISVAPKADDHSAADNLDTKDVVKSLDNSAATSKINSVKATTGSKTNRFGGKKFSPKIESKSSISLGRNINQKDDSINQAGKTTSPATRKSPSSSALSKIPARKISTFNSSKIVVEQKTQGLKREIPKTLQQKKQPENKKETDLKQKQINRSVYKASISSSQPLQDKIIESSTSKFSLVTSTVISNQLKTISKCQSARSNSVSLVSRKNRSASNISSHSTPCRTIMSENETNLRKMISTAGDFNKNDKQDNIEMAASQAQEDEKFQSDESTFFKTDESVGEFKSKLKTLMDEWFSSLKSELKDNNESESNDVQILKSNDILAFIDDWCASAKLSGAERFQKEIEDSNKSLKNLEKKYDDLVAQHGKERFKLEKDLAEKTGADILKKDEQIKEFQNKSKIQEKQINTLKTAVQNLTKEKKEIQAAKDHLQEEHKNFKDCIAATNKKLHDSEQQLKQEKKELKAKSEIILKLENDLVDKIKLETDLAETTKKLEELQTKQNQKTHNDCMEHTKQISEVTKQVSSLETDKEELQQQNYKLKQEIDDLNKVQEKLLETENKLQQLQADLANKENSLVAEPDHSKEVQLELAKFRQSEAEKRREIDKLKIELSKTQFSICQLEQQVQRDQQLLEVRSGLINSLQTNEKTHRTHIEELFAQVGEKNNTINELNSELQTKSEEFRNLFTTLSAKQMEVANQEHIIKLLEESNERSQMLRVKQEEKIGRLEEELAHLKQTIAVYQANVLAGNSGRSLLYSPVVPSKNVDYNENFYYYVSQRKRKRHVDINVKKYEA